MQKLLILTLVAITFSTPLRLNPGKNASFEEALLRPSPVLIEVAEKGPQNLLESAPVLTEKNEENAGSAITCYTANVDQCRIGSSWGHTGWNFGEFFYVTDCLAAISGNSTCNQKIFLFKRWEGCYCFSDRTASLNDCTFVSTGYKTYRKAGCECCGEDDGCKRNDLPCGDGDCDSDGDCEGDAKCGDSNCKYHRANFGESTGGEWDFDGWSPDDCCYLGGLEGYCAIYDPLPWEF